MARTTPIHTGYTIINGTGTGPNGGRIDVWAEYLLGTPNVSGNYTPITAYFYTALNPSYTATTSYYTGLNASFSVNGQAGTGVSNGAYDFSSPQKVNFLGSFSGNIPHNHDGTKTITVSGSFTTLSGYISGGSLSAQVTLPKLLRASAITSASPVTLGNPCHVTWTPANKDYCFSLRFFLGTWAAETERIYPNRTTAYGYSDTTIPLAVAEQFSGATAQMHVTLTTYDGDTPLGTEAGTFSVIVPENDETRPRITAVLSPLCDVFPHRYVCRLGKIQAQVTGNDPYGAEPISYTITVAGEKAQGTVSNPISKSGAVTVTVTGENTRGFLGSYTEEITVEPYQEPFFTQVSAFRCLADGTADSGGTALRITAQGSYSPVAGENTCTARFRIKPEAGDFGQWTDLEQLSDTPIDTRAIPGVALEKTASYTVQVGLVDTAGNTAVSSFFLPMEQVYLHRTKNAMGVGGYVSEEDTLDVHWQVRARKDIACEGAVSGVYIRKVRIAGTNKFSLQTQWQAFDGTGSSRQSVFLFGCVNNAICSGVLGIHNTGMVMWEGTAGVTATANGETGTVTLTLPNTAYDTLTLISCDYIA